MTRVEFLQWVRFYQRWPFDDLHRYQRPAAYVASQLGTGSFDRHLEILLPPEIPEGMTLADYNTMRAFGDDPNEEI